MVGFNIEHTSGCCGVLQITGFSDEDEAQDQDYAAEDWAGMFARLRDSNFLGVNRNTYATNHAAVVQIWFVKYTNYDDVLYPNYVAEELRVLIETIPGVICLGEFNNPNSGNMIKGYQWPLE